ncbi:MAG: B12-binding domain-containing radical SAM protein [Bacteroidota bacterium]|nr:B12-binding domain-containing radical SAM protein [Bacteroidota bacterium]
MKILLVYPKHPDTFWSFKYALKFISKKASFPPLGILTVAAMLPKAWDVKLVDMNVENLTDKEILWSDLVFISAMSVQGESAENVIHRCNNLNRKIVAGGPMFTANYERYIDNVDYLLLNEAELTLPSFLKDLEEGTPKNIYTSPEWADITTTPLPRWDLIKQNKYSSMNIQYSRGCPFDCEFCDITVLYGRKPRTKSKDQVLAELDTLYSTGWVGPVFFVDDNFIGNKAKLKKEILPAIQRWNRKNNFPFSYNTEASINLADDDLLLKQMVETGFDQVFIGIETPCIESLIECNKVQNKKRDLITSIKKIQRAGMEVQAGFIVGFDNDPVTIFDRLANFIQESGIVTAMVGLLNAPKGTKLHKRLVEENRMTTDFTGNNTDFSINFIPHMDLDTLMDGYKNILKKIYHPKFFYQRVTDFLRDFNPVKAGKFQFKLSNVAALGKSMIVLGVFRKERYYYWKLFFWSLFFKPQTFSLAILFAIYGYHFRRIYDIGI